MRKISQKRLRTFFGNKMKVRFKGGHMIVSKKSNINNKSSIEMENVYYDTEYATEFPMGNYFMNMFDALPSNVASSATRYSLEVVSKLLEIGYKKLWERKRIIETEVVPNAAVYQKDNVLAYFNFFSSKSNEYDDEDPFRPVAEKLPDVCGITLYYIESEKTEEVLTLLHAHVNKKESNGKISLVVQKQSGLSTVEYAVPPMEMDIERHYGKEFLPVHEKILTTLNEDQGKGLVLLHGIPGTGKTTYIRYLATQLDKKIIFIPPYLTENIAGPDFVPFLLQNKNSILIIEDAEKVILDRDGGNSNRQGVSNILNLTDGILSDCLNIQVIATFNTSREKIDKALLRKGRLICEWKFDKLSVDNSNKMLEFLEKKERTVEPLALTEIYNIDEVEYAASKKEDAKIGFKH
jgi:hypothetical protein